MSRFFVSPNSVDLINGTIMIDGEDVRHIANVLRAAPGDIVKLTDGMGTDYDASIEHIGKDKILARIALAAPNATEPPVDITLFQGIPKADKMDFIIQKCVELGVKRIVPVMTARTVVKLNNARDIENKTARWRRIALEAAKQCGRGMVPLVTEPVRLEKALVMADSCSLKLIPYEEERDGSLRRQLRQYGQQSSEAEGYGGSSGIAVFIGPEGGFDLNEVDMAINSGFKSVTLGPRILRTETAGLAVIAIIMYEVGDVSKDDR
ncbi:MAG: 16S rRNA (uracil(1498)-N(3))-methyltransferase [Clostridiaceae bacterium]|nr:16S rRNA (uracil(1498)-N(3))-methyltransferase [Clostridiaceae bacterium]